MGALFSIHKVGGVCMMTTLKCEKCDRPAQLMKQATGRTRNGHLSVKKVYERNCACGGEIKALME